MNAEQMKSTLAALADAFTSAGNANVGSQVSQLAKLFDTAGPNTVAKLVTKIETNWKESGRSPRHPKSLKTILEKIKSVFFSSGAKSQTQDFATLLRLFDGVSDQPIDDFVAEARDAFLARKKKPAPRSSGKRSQKLSAEDVSLMAKQLISLKSNRTQFDTLLAKCETAMTVAMLKTAAGIFLGHELPARKKADVIAAMRRRQRQDELNSDRGEAQSKILP